MPILKSLSIKNLYQMVTNGECYYKGKVNTKQIY